MITHIVAINLPISCQYLLFFTHKLAKILLLKIDLIKCPKTFKYLILRNAIFSVPFCDWKRCPIILVFAHPFVLKIILILSEIGLCRSY